jgi:hypothetical protein
MQEFLLLCNRPPRGANADTIIDHIDSIHAMPNFRVREVSMLGDIPDTLDLDRFGAIGIHYSLHISDPKNHFLSQKSIERLAAFKGTKCIWMHDEYRRVDESLKKLQRIGVSTIFTVIPKEVAGIVYKKESLPNTSVEVILTGYVSKTLREIKSTPFKKRALDLVYRARRPPYWLGSFAMEKIDICESFVKKAGDGKLKIDVSVEEWDRIYADEWLEFLSSSKAALAVESGASVIDFTGDIEKSVSEYVSKNKNATFENVRHLVEVADHKLSIKCLSPRIFELAACRTLIVAFPGFYSGIIKPWVHYIPLNKDFSNISEVIDLIKNKTNFCEDIIENAYRDLILSSKYSYEEFSKFCSTKIKKKYEFETKYTSIRFYFDLHRSIVYLRHNYIAFVFQKYVLRTSMRKHMIVFWSRMPAGVQTWIRPVMRYIGR